jgi:hypothetical protein
VVKTILAQKKSWGKVQVLAEIEMPENLAEKKPNLLVNHHFSDLKLPFWWQPAGLVAAVLEPLHQLIFGDFGIFQVQKSRGLRGSRLGGETPGVQTVFDVLNGMDHICYYIYIHTEYIYIQYKYNIIYIYV